MKYVYLLFIVVISINPLIAQKSVLIKYDEELLFEDSISLEEYCNYFKMYYIANSYIKKDKKTLVDRDIYHIIYSCDSTATKKTFRINQHHERIDTSFFTKNTFFYFQKGDEVFIRYLEYNEPKYHTQYNLKALTRAKQSMEGYYNNSYFHSEDYVNISNIKYECYVFEEINDNYRELVYIGKENGFLLKTMTFSDKSISIVEAYEINETNIQK
jgi:hypothetical protein